MSQVLGELRSLAQAIVIWTRPLSDAPAATDGTSRIWLDPRTTQIESRCFTTHEMVHMRRGHIGCQPPSVERSVCLETARLLVTFEDLAQHAGWARSMGELAEELGVTEEVLIDRFQTLDGDQLQILWPNENHIA